ncbi:sensor histidine kinase [Streptomyces sp. NPDC058373]|uniref:sensor histidine kinase n=1 Tax=unclassified Streptomyces TaxID=2593676 RepID=UPI003669B869
MGIRADRHPTTPPPQRPAAAARPATDPADPARDRPARRRPRDWAADFVCFAVAVVIGLTGLDVLQQASGVPAGVAVADQVVGALACAAVWVRRRYPLGFAVATAVVAVVAQTAGGAAVVGLFTVAVHRPLRQVAWVAVFSLASAPLTFWLYPDPGLHYVAAIVFAALLISGTVGWGMYVRSRRQLLLSLRERARRAEAEAELRAAQAQRLAREAIAREMHDVLAHRLTLLSVHAGALEFRPDAPTAEIARAAGVIRDSAHDALQDLRAIIGVLRTGDDTDAARPQPTLDALGDLLDEAREGGTPLTLDRRVTDPAAVPPALGRTVYRIVQECLTNARKHAPGAPVTVTLTGGPGDGLDVAVANAAPPGPVPPVPGSGQGLIGLTERAALAGGRLGHGPAPDGGFRVTAWLPWAS